MKTLFAILSILALTLGAISLDAYHLDVVDCFTAAMVAVMFGLALNDRGRPSYLRPHAR